MGKYARYSTTCLRQEMCYRMVMLLRLEGLGWFFCAIDCQQSTVDQFES